MYTHIELVMEFENQLTGGHHSVGRRENGPSGAHPEQDIGASPKYKYIHINIYAIYIYIYMLYISYNICVL